MSDSENTLPAENEPSGAAKRQPPIKQLASAVEYMRSSAQNEYKRAGDGTAALLLPVSCLLLVLAICMPSSAPLKMLCYSLPLLTFSYYIANRIGIVRTFSTRQAYLTWHILIATFLLGGTATLFLVYTGTTLILLAQQH